MEVELRPARSSSEIRHARKAAVENYPLRATRLDLSVLSDKEQKEIQSLLSDPIKTYVGIGRDVHLTAVNWGMVKREDEFEIWQAQIHSAAALSLKVRFRDFDLGSGMSVKVYGLRGGVDTSVGEYTGRGLGDAGKFWSLSALGDTVVVEYWFPAELEMYPDDFPFKVERISHRFRDEEGKLSGVNVRSFVPRQATCGAPASVCAVDYDSALGVARYYITDDNGDTGQCSGALMNNRLVDFAPYFLTAFHCIDGVVRSSEDPKGTFINTEFWLRYDDCESEYIRVSGARFIAGSANSVADWALLRIDGELTGGTVFLGWAPNPANPESFSGYILHHPGGVTLRGSNYHGIDLRRVDRTGTNSDGSGKTFFVSCRDVGCSHFKYGLEQITASGSSGAPVFSDIGGNYGYVIVGMHTNTDKKTCTGFASRFSKMYEDGRVRGALNYGDDYFRNTGAARNFDDSFRPDYTANPNSIPPVFLPPVIAEGGEIEFQVNYGAGNLSFSLTAVTDEASSLNWQLLANSGPRQGNVRFIRRSHQTKFMVVVVYEVSGGIRQEDQFSVQVGGAGGTDVITVKVTPNIGSLAIAEGEEKEFRVDYGAGSLSFSLTAVADDASSLNWQLVPGSDPRQGNVRFTDNTGSRADIVYEVSGGIRQEDQFSVRVTGGGGSDVIDVRVVVAPVIRDGVEKELSVAYGSGSGALTLSAGAVNPDSLRWQLLSGSGSSVPGSLVYFLKDRGAEARVVYEVPGGINEPDQFFVQVSGSGGNDVITVNVVAAPAIVEGGEEALVVAYGSGRGVLTLNAEAVNPDSLSWSGVTGQGSRVPRSLVYFLKDRGAEARVVYEVPGGIKGKDRFSVRVSDTGGSDEITILVMPDVPPVISRVFGREVTGDDELSIYLSPPTDEVILRAIALDESLDTLEWTIADNPASDSASARFLPNDAGKDVNQVSGTGSVRVRYQRESERVKSSNFVIKVTDRFEQSDSLQVRMVEDATAPEVVNEGVTNTATGKTLEVKIPYSSKQLILNLVTRLARAGLVGEPVSSTPTEVQALFLPDDGEGALKVRLQVPQSLDESLFRIRVINGYASEEIVIQVTREQFIRVRLKAQLGGATQ